MVCATGVQLVSILSIAIESKTAPNNYILLNATYYIDQHDQWSHMIDSYN